MTTLPPRNELSRTELDGRVAMVTGAAGGIGAAVSDALAERGARVFGVDRTAPDADGPFEWLRCDVSDAASVDRTVTRIEERAGPVDILINGAGVLFGAPLSQTSETDWDRVFDVNAKGPFLCIRRTLEQMKRSGYGRIVTISSTAGLTGGSTATAAYGAAKAAAIVLTKAVAREAAPYGITANSIAPFVIETPMIAGLDLRAQRASIPVGRVGTPGDIAAAVVYLCSPAAGYVTGETLRLTGGALP